MCEEREGEREERKMERKRGGTERLEMKRQRNRYKESKRLKT